MYARTLTKSIINTQAQKAKSPIMLNNLAIACHPLAFLVVAFWLGDFFPQFAPVCARALGVGCCWSRLRTACAVFVSCCSLFNSCAIACISSVVNGCMMSASCYASSISSMLANLSPVVASSISMISPMLCASI